MQYETKVSDSKVAVKDNCHRPEFNLPEFKMEKRTNKLSQNAL